jgi:membrane protease YdiL (CAAX protease family)
MTLLEDRKRLIVVAAVGFMLSLLVWINFPEGGQPALFYALLVAFWVFTAAYGKYSGIGPQWQKNIFLGLVAGGGFVILHTWQPSIIRIGYPQVAEGVVFGIISARLLIAGFLAPLGEEIAFRQGLFKWVLRGRFGFLPAAIIVSVFFTFAHWAAYGLGSASAAYMGAFVFSMVVCYLTENTGDCLAAITMHSVVNCFLVISPYVVVGVAGQMMVFMLIKTKHYNIHKQNDTI